MNGLSLPRGTEGNKSPPSCKDFILTSNDHYGRAKCIFPADSVLVLFHLLFDSLPDDVERHVVGQSVGNVYGDRQKEFHDLREAVSIITID